MPASGQNRDPGSQGDKALGFFSRLVLGHLTNPDDDTRRRGRLLLTFSLTLTAVGQFYAGMYYFRYLAPGAALALAVAGILACATLLLPKLGCSLSLASHYLTFVVYSILTFLVVTTGSFAGTTVFWWPLVPSLAVMLVGIRAGRAWALLTVVTSVGIYLMQRRGYEFINVIPEDLILPAFFTSSLGLCLLVPGLFSLYESAVTKMVAEIEASRKESERLRLEAEISHRQARLILDSVSDGLALVDQDGCFIGECSQRFVDWFGQPDPGVPIWTGLEPHLPRFSAWIELAWLQMRDSILPPELSLKQIPSEVKSRDGRILHFELRYIKRPDDASHLPANAQVLVVVSDISEAQRAQIAEEERREILGLVSQILNGRNMTLDSIGEIEALLEELADESQSLEQQERMLHTLKGTAGILGLRSMVRHCHRIEDQLLETRSRIIDSERKALQSRWQSLMESLKPFLLEDEKMITIYRNDINTLADQIKQGARSETLLATLERFEQEPIRNRFQYFANYINDVAQNLGKENIRVEIEDQGLRLPREDWSHFWSNFIHALRNAVDHGADTPDQRSEQGKPEHVTITLGARLDGHQLCISLEDDGPGIQWPSIAEKARAHGLAAESKDQLIEALFMDGISSRGEVTELSGRGVGLSALKQSCEDMGGILKVESQMGVGTHFQFYFPFQDSSSEAA